MYFRIRNTEDGLRVYAYADKAALLAKLEVEFRDAVQHEGCRTPTFCDTMPSRLVEWGSSDVIIKGEIVVPIPKKIIETVDVE